MWRRKATSPSALSPQWGVGGKREEGGQRRGKSRSGNWATLNWLGKKKGESVVVTKLRTKKREIRKGEHKYRPGREMVSYKPHEKEGLLENRPGARRPRVEGRPRPGGRVNYGWMHCSGSQLKRAREGSQKQHRL